MGRVSFTTLSFWPLEPNNSLDSWISELEARHVAVEGGLSHVLEWDTKRGRDFQCIAHFVYCCDGLPDEQIPTAQKMEKWMSRIDRPGDQFKDEIEDVLREFWNIATNDELNDGFTKIGKRLAPIEFVFVGAIISAFSIITLLTFVLAWIFQVS